MHDDALLRLKKIEGQVRGVIKMVEEQKYCIDIINQIAAIEGALDKVSLSILKGHIGHCVASAIKNEKQADEKIDEVVATIERYLR